MIAPMQPPDDAITPVAPHQHAGSVPAMPEEFPSGAGRLAFGKKRDLGWVTSRDGQRYFVIYRRTALSEQIEVRVPTERSEWEALWTRYESVEPDEAMRYVARLSETLARKQSEASRLSEVGLEAPGDLDAGLVLRLPDLTLLGGHGESLNVEIGVSYDLWFRDGEMIVTGWGARYALFAWPYSAIEVIDITGPGAVTTGGGVIGGGFGVVGALEGMAIASIISALTSRTTIKTVLRIESRDAELFLLETRLEPEALRVTLSPIFGRLKRAVRSQAAFPKESSDPIDRLERLAALVESGLMTRDEFEMAKKRLLEQL
jgi:hypothetical protein